MRLSLIVAALVALAAAPARGERGGGSQAARARRQRGPAGGWAPARLRRCGAPPQDPRAAPRARIGGRPSPRGRRARRRARARPPRRRAAARPASFQGAACGGAGRARAAAAPAPNAPRASAPAFRGRESGNRRRPRPAAARRRAAAGRPLAADPPPTRPSSPSPADSITCSLLGSQLQTGPCSNLAGTFKSYAAKYASASCAAIDADAGSMAEPSDSCCRQLRQFAANGCACDSITSSLASAFLGGGDTKAAISGGVKLAQSSRCSLPASGGPIVDSCTGEKGGGGGGRGCRGSRPRLRFCGARAVSVARAPPADVRPPLLPLPSSTRLDRLPAQGVRRQRPRGAAPGVVPSRAPFTRRPRPWRSPPPPSRGAPGPRRRRGLSRLPAAAARRAPPPRFLSLARLPRRRAARHPTPARDMGARVSRHECTRVVEGGWEGSRSASAPPKTDGRGRHSLPLSCARRGRPASPTRRWRPASCASRRTRRRARWEEREGRAASRGAAAGAARGRRRADVPCRRWRC